MDNFESQIKEFFKKLNDILNQLDLPKYNQGSWKGKDKIRSEGDHYDQGGLWSNYIPKVEIRKFNGKDDRTWVSQME